MRSYSQQVRERERGGKRVGKKEGERVREGRRRGRRERGRGRERMCIHRVTGIFHITFHLGGRLSNNKILIVLNWGEHSVLLNLIS